MSLKRTVNWDTEELHLFFKERRSQPFAWGTNDCCMFPADGIKAMTGIDLAEDFRGKYKDEASAFALIASVTGGKTVGDAAAWCAKKFGLVEWADKAGKPTPLFARRGDMVTVENAGREIAGIIGLTGRDVISVAETGLVRLPLTAVKRAWRI